MKKVYVVMSNDYPESVFSDEGKADAYVAQKNADDKMEHPDRLIFWRVYDFAIDARAA